MTLPGGEIEHPAAVELTGKGQFGEAIPHLLRADDDAYGRERAELLFALGKAYEKTGKTTEARATLETASALADAFGGGPVKPVPAACCETNFPERGP